MTRTTRTVAAAAVGLMLSGLWAAPAGAAVRDVTSTCPPQTQADGFPDVDPASTHGAAVSCVAWWDVTAGTAGGGYSPEQVVTRAQMASFLARTIARGGATLPTDAPDAFRDDEGSPHEKAIDQLAELDIVLGRGDGTYGPGAPVRRDQMASFLVRAVEHVLRRQLAGGGDPFTDDDGNVHEAAIEKAAEAGITGGLGAGRYGVAVQVRRGQMASFLVRALDVLLDSRPDWELDGYRMGALLFGTPEDDVVAAMTAAFGEPDAVQPGGCELGGPFEGRFYDWGDLTVHVYAPEGETPVLDSWTVFGTDLPAPVDVRYGLLPGTATRADVEKTGAEYDQSTSDVFGSDYYFLDEMAWAFAVDNGPLEVVSGRPVFCE